MPSYKKREVVETYLAQGDDGAVDTITVYADVIYTTMLDGGSERNVGLKSHKMPDGGHVNVNGGDLEEVATGRKMRRI